MRDMDRAIAKLDEFGAKDVTASLGLDGIDHVKLDLEELTLKLDELDHKHVDINVKVDDSGINQIENDARRAESAIGGGGMGGGGGLIGAIALLGPALAPIGGVALGGLGAIAASAGVAGVGVLAFGAVAMPVFKQIITDSQNLQKVWTAIDNAKTPAQLAAALQKQKIILDSMSPAEAKAVKGFMDLEKQYKSLQNSIKPEVYSIFGKGLEFVTSILKIAAPLVKDVAREVDYLMTGLQGSLKTADVSKDIKDLTTNAQQFIEFWAKSVGNFIVGIMNMLDAFLPLSKSFNGGMLEMSRKFRDWTSHLSSDKSFQNFVKYVQENTPTVIHLLGGIVTLAANLVKALAPLGGVILTNVTTLVDKINDFAKNNPHIAALAATVTALGVGIGTLPGVSGLATKALEPLLALLAENPAIAIVAGLVALSVAVGKAKDKAPFFKQLGGLWNDLKKTAKDLAHELAPLWNFFKEHISGNLIIFGTNVIKIFRDLLPIIKPLVEFIALELVAELEVLAVTLRLVSDALEFVVRIVMWAVKEIVKPFEWLYDKLVGHSIIPDLINGIIKWFKKLPGELLSLAGQAARWVVNAFISLPGKVWGFFKDMYGKVTSEAGKIITWMKGLPKAIVGALGDLGHLLWNAGVQIINGLWGGLKSKWNDAKKWVHGIAGDITSLKGPLEYDKVMLKPHGQAIIEGLVDGMQSRHEHLRRALGKVTDTIRGTAMPGVTVSLAGKNTSARPSASASVASGGVPAGTRIGVYVAPGGIQVQGGTATTEKKISDQLTRVARFGAFGNAGL